MRPLFIIFALAVIAYGAPASSEEKETATVASKSAEVKKPLKVDKAIETDEQLKIKTKEEQTFIEKAVDYVVDGFNSIVAKIKSAIGVNEEKKDRKAVHKSLPTATEPAETKKVDTKKEEHHEKKEESKVAKDVPVETKETKKPVKQEKKEDKSSEETEKKVAAVFPEKEDSEEKKI